MYFPFLFLCVELYISIREGVCGMYKAFNGQPAGVYFYAVLCVSRVYKPALDQPSEIESAGVVCLQWMHEPFFYLAV